MYFLRYYIAANMHKICVIIIITEIPMIDRCNNIFLKRVKYVRIYSNEYYNYVHSIKPTGYYVYAERIDLSSIFRCIIIVINALLYTFIYFFFYQFFTLKVPILRFDHMLSFIGGWRGVSTK